MEESILTSIKKLLNISVDDKSFDLDIIIHINTVFMTLNQIGIGPSNGFSITDKTTTWSDYLVNTTDLEGVKTYIYLRVKMIFDPPTNGSVIEAYNNLIKEYEWRLNTQIELKDEE